MTVTNSAEKLKDIWASAGQLKESIKRDCMVGAVPNSMTRVRGLRLGFLGFQPNLEEERKARNPGGSLFR